VTNFAVSGSAGTGTIDVDPNFPVTVGKTSGAGDTVLANAITLGGGSTISLRADAGVGRLVLDGKISGANDLYKTGAGTVVLSNPANDYAGRTIVASARVASVSSSAMGALSRRAREWPATPS